MNDPGYQADQPSEREHRRTRPDDDEARDADEPRRRRRRYADDDDDYRDRGPDGLESLVPYRNPKGLIAYYAGVFSFIPLLGAVLGPAAFVFGILGVKYANRYPKARGKGHAISGIVMGSLTTLLNWGCILLISGVIAFGK